MIKDCSNGVCRILTPTEEQEVQEQLYKESQEEADKAVRDAFKRMAEDLE